jgi:hypothetical protein
MLHKCDFEDGMLDSVGPCHVCVSEKRACRGAPCNRRSVRTMAHDVNHDIHEHGENESFKRLQGRVGRFWKPRLELD